MRNRALRRSLLARAPHSRSLPWIAAARATAGASAMPRPRLPGRLLVCLPVGACAAAEMAQRRPCPPSGAPAS